MSVPPIDDRVLATAAEHVTTRVPTARPEDTAGAVRDGLIGARHESVADVVVLRDGRLEGLVPIAALLAAPASATMAALMNADPPVVGPGLDQEAAALRLLHSDDTGLAVVDGDGVFRGLITPHRMLAVLYDEHDEDLARIGGYMATTARARSAAEEGVWQRLLHRVPWLLVGLVGAMLAAVIVGSFEEQLRQEVLLAFFAPGVVYMADAIGTQTEALVIRGLAVGVGIRRMAIREIVTGLALGVIVAAAFLPLGRLIWDDGRVAVAVSLAFLASCAIATAVAMALPLVLQRLGRDPAFGAGPLATVVQDLLSLLIYFSITAAIVL